MPGQPGQQPMKMESIVAVLKFSSSVSSSDEDVDDCEIEICDDPTATLVVHESSPSILEREETDSGIYGEFGVSIYIIAGQLLENFSWNFAAVIWCNASFWYCTLCAPTN